jgi:hypothetical protein
MPSPFDCPQCGASGDIYSRICRKCGVSLPKLPIPGDELIASWLSLDPDPADSRPAVGESVCPKCGYTGEMASERGRTRCPACFSEYVGDRAREPSPVRLVIACPHCGVPIRVSDNDRDKTILCPQCKCFLGCVLKSAR